MSLMIGDNTVARIHYTLTDNAGEVLDSSEGADPLSYLHGAGNIIPGLEQALTGKTGGATLQVSIAPEDAYGDVQPELVQVVPAEAFQGVETVEPGMAFQARQLEQAWQDRKPAARQPPQGHKLASPFVVQTPQQGRNARLAPQGRELAQPQSLA